jgi:hypothetical protein
MARRFLWVFLALLVAVLAGLIAWRLFAPQLLRLALVPGKTFAEVPAPAAPDYAGKAAWIAHPALPGNPALFVPAGFRPAPRPAAAVFFVPPTAFFDRSRWNDPLDDPATNERLARFVEGQASAFNGIAEIWAPRYRQATLGSFLTDRPDADAALALAYSDVERAFAAFLAAQPADRPILLAGHSQGTRHLLRLVAEGRLAERLGNRLVAVYAIGWPVSEARDLPLLGMLPCETREQPGCILSWQSFAADGDLGRAGADLSRTRAIDGRPVGPGAMLCANPLTGTRDGEAEAKANPGSLSSEKTLVPGLTGARCAPPGLLLISPVPEGRWPLVFPGGNFHAYDFHLFWSSVRADAEARLMSVAARRLQGADG